MLWSVANLCVCVCVQRLNLTPVGGLCFSETGALCRRWNWLYRCGLHVRKLPFKPLTFALGPHMGVRIHSQERMYINFTHRQNKVNFNVGSKLKVGVWRNTLQMPTRQFMRFSFSCTLEIHEPPTAELNDLQYVHRCCCFFHWGSLVIFSFINAAPSSREPRAAGSRRSEEIYPNEELRNVLSAWPNADLHVPPLFKPEQH